MLIFDQYIERLNRREAKPTTIRNMSRTKALFEESGLDPMKAEDWQIEEWLASLDLSQRTKRLHFENLSAVYGYAVHRRLLSVAPTEFVKMPKEPDKEPRILTPDELRSILGAAQSDQDYLLAHLLVYTGMRRNEIRTLEWENVKPVDNTITVINGKGDKLRHVPIHPRLGEVLAEVTHTGVTLIHGNTGGALAENAMWYRLKRISGEITCTFHDFRRTVATSLAENDVPERLIDEILGWAPRTVGRRYYIRNASRKVQEAILKLYADAPITTR